MALSDLVPFSAVDASVVAFWNLQEASASDTWDNGQGNASWDASPAGGSQPAVSTTTVNGNWARSRVGDTNDYASFNNPGFPTGAFTVEFIMQGANTPSDDEPVLAAYPTTGGQRSLVIWRAFNVPQRSIGFQVSGNGSSFSIVNSNTTTANGEWYYVACVFEPSTAIRIYINGSLDNSNTSSIPAALHNTTSPYFFMRYNATRGGPNAFDGYLQAMRISNVARDATFISNYWSGGGGGGGGASVRTLASSGVGQ